MRLAELGGRRALRLLYGAILAWVLVADTAAVIKNLEPPALREQIELAARQISPKDAILCLDELCRIDFQAARRLFVSHQGSGTDPAVAGELERLGFRRERTEGSGPQALSIYGRAG